MHEEKLYNLISKGTSLVMLVVVFCIWKISQYLKNVSLQLTVKIISYIKICT